MTARKGFVHLAAIIVIIITGISLLLILTKSSKIEKSISPASQAPLQQIKEATTAAQVTPVDRLEKYLTVEAALLGVSDNVSLYFKDLKTPREVALEPVRSWIPASTIKAYVILEAFRQKRLGIIDFNDQIQISADNVVPTELETDDFPKLREGTTATIGQLVEAMIEQSDNIAYNALLDVLDRRNINSTLRNLGITETIVGQKLNLDDTQTQKDLGTPGYQLNTTTAKDLATLFDLLYSKKIPDSDTILDIFKKQKINNMIPALLPEKTQIAHKTGDLAPIYHDGGLIFKQDDPFILSIFTNSNDPTIVAKLAQVAYFQNADIVGKTQAKIGIRSYLADNKLAQSTETFDTQNLNARVLAESDTNENFPNITATDLGITSQDLNPEKAQAKNIRSAFFTPGTFFYNIKKFIENTRLKLARDNKQIAMITLDASQNRLSEAKATALKGDIKTARDLINQSEQDMKKSIDISQTGQQTDEQLLKIKQVNDLHYATLAEIAPKIAPSQKEAFVDMAYDFYLKNKKEVKPTIEKSLEKTSTRQEPIIGTVAKVSGNNVTIKFDDGTTKEIVTNNSILSRKFDSDQVSTGGTLQEGTRIAVVGQTAQDGKIIPTFVLKNIPALFPDKKKGTVTKIEPQKDTIEIVDKQGKQQEIKVNDDTIIKAKDTNVSLDGIKPGSQVTVFSSPPQNPPLKNIPIIGGEQSTIPPPVVANTVTVTQNASGKNEKKEEKNRNQPTPPSGNEKKEEKNRNQPTPPSGKK